MERKGSNSIGNNILIFFDLTPISLNLTEDQYIFKPDLGFMSVLKKEKTL